MRSGGRGESKGQKEWCRRNWTSTGRCSALLSLHLQGSQRFGARFLASRGVPVIINDAYLPFRGSSQVDPQHRVDRTSTQTGSAYDAARRHSSNLQAVLLALTGVRDAPSEKLKFIR